MRGGGRGESICYPCATQTTKYRHAKLSNMLNRRVIIETAIKKTSSKQARRSPFGSRTAFTVVPISSA
jgi:hypothetical protein